MDARARVCINIQRKENKLRGRHRKKSKDDSSCNSLFFLLRKQLKEGAASAAPSSPQGSIYQQSDSIGQSSFASLVHRIAIGPAFKGCSCFPAASLSHQFLLRSLEYQEGCRIGQRCPDELLNTAQGLITYLLLPKSDDLDAFEHVFISRKTESLAGVGGLTPHSLQSPESAWPCGLPTGN